MSPTETRSDDVPALDRHLSEGQAQAADRLSEDCDQSWLSEIVGQLESDPEECSQALEGLLTVEADLRLSIIDELSVFGARPGARTLLRLLSSAHDRATSAAARRALARMDGEAHEPLQLAEEPPLASKVQETGTRGGDGNNRFLLLRADSRQQAPPLAGCLVTPVDGVGRGTIVVSVNGVEERHTAAFLCDVQLGIRDVVGESEPESPRAGALVDDLDRRPEAGCVRDAPELALGLLAGSLLLSGPAVPEPVSEWLRTTLGPEFQPAGFPATIPGLEFRSIAQTEMPGRAGLVLEACPSWLDLSPLTFELAEEIWLRERRTTSDPDRDAGAFRFLFEHRLIHRLELYRRMLLWMAWLWKFSGEIELSRSALALSSQLADEQYAVPSHPFTVELTMRSLTAAQGHLGTTADPRL